MGNNRPARPSGADFNFGHTHPERSNSGLLTLVLMAYELFQERTQPYPRGRGEAGIPEVAAHSSGASPARAGHSPPAPAP